MCVGGGGGGGTTIYKVLKHKNKHIYKHIYEYINVNFVGVESITTRGILTNKKYRSHDFFGWGGGGGGHVPPDPPPPPPVATPLNQYSFFIYIFSYIHVYVSDAKVQNFGSLALLAHNH